eukprot:2903605-Ditylum_brightwellii.AAC.1
MGPGAQQQHIDRGSVDSEEQSRASNHSQMDDSTTPDPMDSEEQIKSSAGYPEHNTDKISVKDAAEINNELLNNITLKDAAPPMVAITGYRWKDGVLQLRYLMSTEEAQWVNFLYVKIDHPKQTT